MEAVTKRVGVLEERVAAAATHPAHASVASPQAVSDLLQQRPGLVQMVVSRLIPLGRGTDSRSGSEGDMIRSSYDELRQEKEPLTHQLSRLDSSTSNWRELHGK